MSAIVISVPGKIWEAWRADLQPVWSWSSSAKVPPVRAGEKVYVAALGRVQAFGILENLVLGEVKPPSTSYGHATRCWTLFVRGFEPIADGPRMSPLATWRYPFWEGA